MTLHALQRRTLILSAVLGCLGVFSGYALFVLVREQLISGKGTTFLLAVLVAGIMSFAIEWVRDVIRHGHEEPLRFSRVVVTIFTLMMFEIFVIALHEIPSWHLAEVSELPRQLLGEAAEHGGHPLTNLFLLTGIWFIAGAMLAATLSWSIFAAFDQGEQDAAMSLQVARSTKRGIGGGAIVAPLAALAAVLILRILVIARLYFFHHAEWRESMQAIVSSTHWSGGAFTAIPHLSLVLLLWLDGLWGGWMIGPLLTVGLYIGLLVAATKAETGWPMTFLIIVGVIIFFQPLVHDLKALFAIPLLASLVWSIPGLVLGALNPLLRRPSELPREWGILACIAAGVLLIATWSRFNGWWIFPLVLLSVAIVYFRRGVSVEEYWPFVALSVAIIVAGATSLIQYISFAGVLRQLHEVNSLPAYIVEAPGPVDRFGLNPRMRQDLVNSKEFQDLLDRFGKKQWPTTLGSSLHFATTQPNLFPLTPPTSEQIDASPFRQHLGGSTRFGLGGISTTKAAQTPPAPGHLETTESPADTPIHRDTAHVEEVAESALDTHVERSLNEAQTARLLETCLSAAFAFWCTVAMLATWAMLRAHDRGEPEHRAE